MRKLSIVLMTVIGIISCYSCKTNKILKDYPSLKKTTNIIKYVDIDEVFRIFDLNDNKKYIIVFGFKTCQWCQAAIRFINDIALEKEYTTIGYLDIKVMRDDADAKEHKKYLELYEKIKYDIGNPSRINAPTTVVIKNGEILGFHEGTVEGHEKVNGTLPIMTEDQQNELKEIYRAFF